MPFLLAALVLAWLSQGTTPSPQAAATQSPCPVADDEKYAYSTEQPVLLGGGAATVVAREQAYLNALRGPAGQVLKYQRRGSSQSPAKTIIDVYEVTYDGLEKPITLYLDVYRWSDPKAPKGLTCAGPIPLNPPPPDPFVTQGQLRELAATLGASKEFAPIPLDADGTAAHGVAFDHFRLIARASHAAAQAGKPLNPTELPSDVGRIRTIVVAYPLTCNGKTVAPQSVDIINAQQGPLPRAGEQASGEKLDALLPGAKLPPGSVAATFNLIYLRPNDSIRIAYAEPACPDSAREVLLPLKIGTARLLKPVEGKRPADMATSPTPVVVRVQIIIDPDGKPHFATYAAGPFTLADQAVQAAAAGEWDPPRVNGAPILVPITTSINFK